MIIGLTGGIATGKSSVAELFEELGAVRVDTDCLARKAVEPGKPAWQKIICEFGREILDDEQRIDRKALAAIVFNDNEKLKRLNGIIHPVVRALLREQIAEAVGQGAKVIVVEVPLLFEAGFENEVDKIITVSVNEQIQFARLMQRSSITEAEAVKRIESQMPQNEKLERADMVIDNSGTWEKTKEQIIDLWQAIQQEYQNEI